MAASTFLPPRSRLTPPTSSSACARARGSSVASLAPGPRSRVAPSSRPRLPIAPRVRRPHPAPPRAGDGEKGAGDGNAFESADDWIANWKAGNFPRAKGWKFGDPSSAGPGTFEETVGGGGGDGAGEAAYEEVEPDLSSRYGGDPNDYVYVFCHNLMSPPGDSFACMYLSDVLGAVSVPLVAPDLRAGDAESDADDFDFTVTSAIDRLREAVAEASGPEEKKVRLLGSSLGAYVAAVYAELEPARVDRVMLLAPTFDPAECLTGVEREMGVEMSAAFREDLKNHPRFPFTPAPAYVVHGYDDEASPLANSLTWVRDASANLRAGSEEKGEVAERRLLEVGGMGHGIENALPQIKSRLVEFFKLPFALPEGLE
jgi:pimeloyl-ACP methyl ester carboxylesterase